MENLGQKTTPPPTNSYENYDAQLNEWSQKVGEFRNKLTKLNEELQIEATQKVERLEKKYQEVTEKVGILKSKGLSAKDEVKIGFEKAWKELIQAFDAAKKTFH
jgi:predicted nuclease with TOPRIM domain